MFEWSQQGVSLKLGTRFTNPADPILTRLYPSNLAPASQTLLVPVFLEHEARKTSHALWMDPEV